MINLEWAHVIFAGAGAIVGAVGGLIAGVWKVAHVEQEIRKDCSQEIAEAAHELGGKLSDIASQFDETLKGLRQKINDVELEMVKGFVAKGDFDDFRAEYREDMRDLKNSIAQIPRTH